MLYHTLSVGEAFPAGTLNLDTGELKMVRRVSKKAVAKKAPAKKAQVTKKESKQEEQGTEGVSAEKKKGRRGSPKFSPTSVVNLRVEENPKRKNSKSYDRFELYEDGMTVAEATEAGVLYADLEWDFKHGFISVDGEFQDPPPKAPKKKKASKKKDEEEDRQNSEEEEDGDEDEDEGDDDSSEEDEDEEAEDEDEDDEEEEEED